MFNQCCTHQEEIVGVLFVHISEASGIRNKLRRIDKTSAVIKFIWTAKLMEKKK